MKTCAKICISLILVMAAGNLKQARAAVPWTPEQIALDYELSGAAHQPPFVLPERLPPRALDDPAYFLHYQMLCDFLVSRQFTGAGSNNGGMIEGESGGDQNIIETDNTQEAIRIWSQYAVWTGDTARYGNNIRMAQGYCGRWPAWREGAGFYSIHNCGWGFEAEKIYRQAYQDTMWTWYADSCAWWVNIHPLTIDTVSTSLGQLDPLAEGLGIGGMYPHAVYRGRTDWQDFALGKARLLRRWFERNPARLHSNETWALCGGTALWGMCVSLFAAYPDSGVAWLSQYAPQLDIWQSTGTWNHSFNAWYCNAHYEVFGLLQDSTYWNNAIFITDSLIGLDTDGDGGIPPGWTYPATNDHSWVSAYMGWMGMERVINTTPQSDAAVIAFASPNPNLPYLAGDPLTISVRIGNAGRGSISGMLVVTGSGYLDSVAVNLALGESVTAILPSAWTVPDNAGLPDSSLLSALFRSEADEVPGNNDLAKWYDIRHGVSIAGSITEAGNPSLFVPSQVRVYHENYPDSAWTTFTTGQAEYASGPRPLLEGLNRIVVQPAVQFMEGEMTASIPWEGSPYQADFSLERTDVALVDDDVNQNFETWYLSSLDSFPQLNVRVWPRAQAPLTDLSGVPTVIWFCGHDSTTTLTASDQTLLQTWVAGGGNLLLIGQNIPEDPAAAPFMSTVIQCTLFVRNVNIRRVTGLAGDPIMDGTELFLIGTNGANNATSPSSITVLGGTQIARYSSGDEDPCGVAGEYGAGKYVFFSFPLEAASGLNGSTTREEVLGRCFAWFGDSTVSASAPPEIPAAVWLAPGYPNPFNPATTIRFFAATADGPVHLAIYNLLGQEIRRLYDGPGPNRELTLTWDGRTQDGRMAATGLYVYRLTTSGATLSRTLQLIR